MKSFAVLCLGLLISIGAQASGRNLLVQSGYWTGDNMYSSAPSPRCACDKDPNVIDCEPVEETKEAVGYICYDEFIPFDSKGWVHAEVHSVKSY